MLSLSLLIAALEQASLALDLTWAVLGCFIWEVGESVPAEEHENGRFCIDPLCPGHGHVLWLWECPTLVQVFTLSEGVYNALAIHLTCNRCISPQICSSGDARQYYAGILPLSRSLNTTIEIWNEHILSTFIVSDSLGFVDCLVREGIVVGCPCCGVHNCTGKLRTAQDHFCAAHQNRRLFCMVTHPTDTIIPAAPVDHIVKEEVGDPTCSDKPTQGNHHISTPYGHLPTHDEQLLVCPCMIITTRETFYGSEGVLQVIDMLKKKHLIPGSMSRFIFYDNSCTLFCTCAATPGRDLHLHIGLPVDIVHWTSKHKKTDIECSFHCNPHTFPNLLKDDKPWVLLGSPSREVLSAQIRSCWYCSSAVLLSMPEEGKAGGTKDVKDENAEAQEALIAAARSCWNMASSRSAWDKNDNKDKDAEQTLAQ
ncbi:hypothetical protein FKP32DRAFT_1602199 [Trametes sanguinea]|nr:hypothetical protein FKP32DRAFT_1602199 [Trametes sanguinea]